MSLILLISKWFTSLLPNIKRYWQILAGAGAALALYIFKRNYDSKIKKETIKEVESVARETTAREQVALASASEAITISHMSNPLPSWDGLEQLSKKARPSAKAKAAKDKILRKLRRKD